MRRSGAWLLAVALVVAAVGAAAAAVYGVRIEPGPTAGPGSPVVPLTEAAQRQLGAEPVLLARDAATRHAEMLTLRVRNITCGGLEIGSGFAIDPHTLITNRHVIAGAAVIELDAWDGASVQADISQAAGGRLVDIGVVRVSATLPAVAVTGPPPRAGDPVTAVGYPLGGPLTLSRGKVLGYVDGRTLPTGISFDGQVIEISAPIHHGNSGGPLLDSQGRVVGVVYAGQFAPGASEDSASRVGYVIPLDEVDSLLASGGSQAIVPCQQ